MSDDLVRRLQTSGDVLRHIEAQAARIAELEAVVADLDTQIAAFIRGNLAGGEDE